MNIYVSNLEFTIDEEDLKQAFSQYGTVDTIKIIIDRKTKKSKGYAFIEMPSDNEAQKAIEALNNYMARGRKMQVKKAENKK